MAVMTIEQIVELAKAAKFKEIKSADPQKRLFQRAPSHLSISLSGPWVYYPERKGGSPSTPSGRDFWTLAEFLKTSKPEDRDDEVGEHVP
jgi:hypothetical protein